MSRDGFPGAHRPADESSAYDAATDREIESILRLALALGRSDAAALAHPDQDGAVVMVDTREGAPRLATSDWQALARAIPAGARLLLGDGHSAAQVTGTTDPEQVAFYAGMALHDRSGKLLGALVLADREPREAAAFFREQAPELETLGRCLVRYLESRPQKPEARPGRDPGSPVAVCAWCSDVRDPDGRWVTPTAFLNRALGLTTTHGICEHCALLQYGE